MTVTVPEPPPLATVANVELMHTGTWALSTGEATFTTGDLAAAVAAVDCPAVRAPVLKLGHVDPRFDGEPAVGRVENLAVAEDGHTLVGDYAGMPGWLGDVIASAYPDRSIEGQYDFRCQLGHTHPFVVTAVALLGVTAPGIGTLESLADVAALYGVAAAGGDGSGDRVEFIVHASREDDMPGKQVAASVTSEDVRRAFYSSPMATWDTWIEEIQLDPPQLIIVDDASGTRSRVPYTVGSGDGEQAVSFAEAVKVVIRYEDAPQTTNASVVRFASRAESRPDGGERPAGAGGGDDPGGQAAARREPETAAAAMRRVHEASQKTPAAGSAGGATKREELDVEFSNEQAAKLRSSLGLADDAELDPESLLEAVGKLQASNGGSKGDAGKGDSQGKAKDDEKGKQPVAASGHATVVLDAQTYEDMERRIRAGEEARKVQLRDERDRELDAAIRAGKFPPSRKDTYARLWDADPEGTKNLLASLTPGNVPVADMGYPGDPEAYTDSEFERLFPPTASSGKRN